MTTMKLSDTLRTLADQALKDGDLLAKDAYDIKYAADLLDAKDVLIAKYESAIKEMEEEIEKAPATYNVFHLIIQFRLKGANR